MTHYPSLITEEFSLKDGQLLFIIVGELNDTDGARQTLTKHVEAIERSRHEREVALVFRSRNANCGYEDLTNARQDWPSHISARLAKSGPPMIFLSMRLVRQLDLERDKWCFIDLGLVGGVRKRWPRALAKLKEWISSEEPDASVRLFEHLEAVRVRPDTYFPQGSVLSFSQQGGQRERTRRPGPKAFLDTHPDVVDYARAIAANHRTQASLARAIRVRFHSLSGLLGEEALIRELRRVGVFEDGRESGG